MHKIVISLILVIFLFPEMYGQYITAEEKKQLVESQIKNIEENQKDLLYSKRPFLTGIHYFSNTTNTTHPYYQSKSWLPGKIIFENREYPVEALKYDIFKDYIIYYAHFTSAAFSTGLNKEFIKEFYLEDHRFKYLELTENKPIFMQPGYYEIASEGNTRFVIKWSKEEIISSNYTIEYKPYTKMIIYSDGQYRRFSSQLKLLQILKDHKKELKEYIRAKKLVFSSNKIAAAKQLVDYYNKLEDQ